MANIQSMKKDLRRNAKKRVVNQAFKSSLKTYLKKARGNEKTPSTPEAVVLAIKASAAKYFDRVLDINLKRAGP
jgi:ribosomal protein S20